MIQLFSVRDVIAQKYECTIALDIQQTQLEALCSTLTEFSFHSLLMLCGMLGIALEEIYLWHGLTCMLAMVVFLQLSQTHQPNPVLPHTPALLWSHAEINLLQVITLRIIAERRNGKSYYIISSATMTWS